MKYIDEICRKNDIEYFIMGGTALGAVRHGGFIPWDDDLDIFMTPDNYSKFKNVFDAEDQEIFVLQEWRSVPTHLEYAKVRMNGTTFIESNFKHCRNLHQGIYVDIMILHKVPNNRWIQKIVYLESKFVTLYGLSQRNWKPKTKIQTIALNMLKILPGNLMGIFCYKSIYKYENLENNFSYCYWITPAKFSNGIFDETVFSKVKNITFEDCNLYGPNKIHEYLEQRYGNYMELPSKEKQEASIHAEIFDVDEDYSKYIE